MYNDNEYYNEEEELNIIPLKGVGVKDIENGIKVVLMTMEDEILKSYNINVDLKGYDDNKLFKVCYAISQKVNELYYEYNGELTQDIVEQVVRSEI